MTIQSLQQIELVVNPLPQLAGEPLFDFDAQEWYARDSDGIAYWADTPAGVYRQYHEALRIAADHYRHCGADAVLTRGPQHDLAAAHLDERPWHS